MHAYNITHVLTAQLKSIFERFSLSLNQITYLCNDSYVEEQFLEEALEQERIEAEYYQQLIAEEGW